MPQPFYSPEEVAELFQVPRRTIVRMCSSGKLPAARVSVYWRIPAESVERLREARVPSKPLRSATIAPLTVDESIALASGAIGDLVSRSAALAEPLDVPAVDATGAHRAPVEFDDE